MKYYKLTDELNLNEVVKDDNGKECSIVLVQKMG